MHATEQPQRSAKRQMSSARALMVAALSVVVPGAGHLVIRRWGRAAIWFAGWIVVVGTSGSGHNAAVIALMAVAAVDAVVFARIDAREAVERPGAGREAA